MTEKPNGAPTPQKKPLVNRRIGFKVHVGYIVDEIIVQGLHDLGWRIAHNTPEQFEWRKQDANGAWTVDQDSEEFQRDFAGLGGGKPI